jgi:hypothetical protein
VLLTAREASDANKAAARLAVLVRQHGEPIEVATELRDRVR